MQQDFIDELENRGKANIRTKEVKIQSLLEEENTLMNSNETLTENFKLFRLNWNNLLVPATNFVN